MERNPSTADTRPATTGDRRRMPGDLLQGIGDAVHGIDALGAMLRTMNPYALGNPQGICESCAWETVHVLVEGRKPRPILAVDPPDATELAEWHEQERKNWQEEKQRESRGGPKAPDAPRAHAFGEHRLRTVGSARDPRPGHVDPNEKRQETEFLPEPARGQAVFRWLSNAQHGEAVFVAEGGGHVWNFLRFDGRIYLLDASIGVYRALPRAEDARATYWPRAGEPIPFDYCDPVSLSNPTRQKTLTIHRCGGPIHPVWRRLLAPPPPRGEGRFREAPH